MRTFMVAILVLLSAASWADRIKDLTSVAGVRSNQLVGYGLVVGLQGTGDGADIDFTSQTMKSLLDRLGASLATEGRRSDFDISQQQPRQRQPLQALEYHPAGSPHQQPIQYAAPHPHQVCAAMQAPATGD